MSALDIYLVMQADEFKTVVGIFGTVFCALGGILTAMAHVEDLERKLKVSFGVMLATGFLFAAVSTLTPSTKTLAAMIVLPDIINSPELKSEAHELYSLAKEALRGAAGVDVSK